MAVEESLRSRAAYRQRTPYRLWVTKSGMKAVFRRLLQRLQISHLGLAGTTYPELAGSPLLLRSSQGAEESGESERVVP